MHEISGAGIGARLEKAVLAGIIRPSREIEDSESFLELARLAETAGAAVVADLKQKRKKPDPKFFIGKGKVGELKEIIAQKGATLVVLNDNLKPSQAKALEDELETRVIDRTELILDIFATGARTQLARLQVELAQLEYFLPRLKRLWTHLSRMEGGIGMRGPGEAQIEDDRRAAKTRIGDLRRKLAEIESRTERTVASREGQFKISLVGYTNSGKSTLLNRLTGSDVLVEDKLFSTLDTRTRVWTLSSGRTVLLSDTVGFIRDLPHSLVASFHATLEETRHADLLLHVVDLDASDVEGQMTAVEGVLRDIGASGVEAIAVFNKVDVLREAIDLESLKRAFPSHVVVSALTGLGIADLDGAVQAVMERSRKPVKFMVPHSRAAVAAQIMKLGRVLSVEYDEKGACIEAMIDPAEEDRIRKILAR